MMKNHRGAACIVGMAAGALLAAPLISLLASPVANADPDVTTLGPYDLGGYDVTLSYNDASAVDGYVTGTYDGTCFDLDAYFAPPGSDSFDLLLTDPGVFQFGVDDVDGSISYIDNFLGVDFLPADPGRALL